jgi:hypothetical protein
MSNPPAYRYSWYVIAHDYNFHSMALNKREDGTCLDGTEWHLVANRKYRCNCLFKFDRSLYDPTTEN